jgi:hypothetical protein
VQSFSGPVELSLLENWKLFVKLKVIEDVPLLGFELFCLDGSKSKSM